MFNARNQGLCYAAIRNINYSASMDLEGKDALSVIIVGASGDLARKKLLPALFSLYSQGFMPDRFHVFGFARSAMSHEDFRARVGEHLTCRYVPEHDCERKMAEFLSRCHYVQGSYDSPDSFMDLYQVMKPLELGQAHRLYYLAIPPSIFVHVARAMGRAGLVTCTPGKTWSRVIIEKPFGSDRESSDRMAHELAQAFPERDIYRIDHYLGKEIIQNLLVLRFANTIFEPLWNGRCIEQVQITWKENIGIGSRAGYFDEYGIIRDVIQNHMMQILSLVAMERPATLNAQAIRDAKLDVLKHIPPLQLKDLVVGQYRRNGKNPSYNEEEGVPRDSITPSYAAMALRVDHARWEGVPFLIRAGKGLNARCNEIRIRFRPATSNLFSGALSSLPANQLVIRVQPDEAVALKVVSKVPGLKLTLAETELDLRYATAFNVVIPEAYEGLILDAIRGEKSLFIRSDELAAAWDIFTPVLHELEQRRIKPEPYDFGSEGPAAAGDLAARHGVEWL